MNERHTLTFTSMKPAVTDVASHWYRMHAVATRQRESVDRNIAEEQPHWANNVFVTWTTSALVSANSVAFNSVCRAHSSVKSCLCVCVLTRTAQIVTNACRDFQSCISFTHLGLFPLTLPPVHFPVKNFFSENMPRRFAPDIFPASEFPPPHSDNSSKCQLRITSHWLFLLSHD